MCNIDGAVRGVVGNGVMDTVKNVGQDIGNGVNGLVNNPLTHDIEQAASGGKGWGGLARNVAAVVAAPATGGASLAGSQWADNVLGGTGVFGQQADLSGGGGDQGPKIPAGETGGGGGGGIDLSGILKTGGDIAKAVGPTVGDYLGSQAQADVAKRGQDMQKQAYDEMMARSKEGETQFLNANTQTNPAISAYATDMQNLNTKNIGRNQNTINQNLVRSGVSGGQAANLYGRQIGDLQASGQRDINQLAYQDAAAKNTANQQYFANKGQSGFNLVPKYS